MLEYELYLSVDSDEKEIDGYISLLETLKEKHDIDYRTIDLESFLMMKEKN